MSRGGHREGEAPADGAGPAGTSADGARADEPAAADGVAELAAEMQRVLLVSSRILRSHTASQDVSAPQFSVLAYLHRAGESTPGSLADFEHVSPPVMTRMLGRLEEAGLVRRSAHPGDGRQVLVALTDAGRAAVLAGREERDAWLRSRLGEVTEADREQLRAATALLRRTLIAPRD